LARQNYDKSYYTIDAMYSNLIEFEFKNSSHSFHQCHTRHTMLPHDHGNAAATATPRGENIAGLNTSVVEFSRNPTSISDSTAMQDEDGLERKERGAQELGNETAAAETIHPGAMDTAETLEAVTASERTDAAIAATIHPGVTDAAETLESVTANEGADAAIAEALHRTVNRPRIPSEEEILARLQIFQHQQHSLRVSASNVAAMIGFHPWKNLPELLMNLVYQGCDGQRLLRRDSKLLGLTLVSEETILLQIAAKAGDSTRMALQSALQIKDGSKKVETVELAKTLKEKVLQEAKKTGKLNKKEMKVLSEGARSAVDTGYGTAHEDGALDLYEKQCGWPVEQRNAEVREWPFVRLEDAKLGPGQENATRVEQPTVVPLGTASSGFRKPKVELGTDAQEEPQTNSAAKRQKVVDLTGDSDVCLPPSDPPMDAKTAFISSSICTPVATEAERSENTKPFFSIMGSVDGIRDELAPSTDKGSSESPSDDDSWVFRKVIVECKHRMNRIHVVPPLYEQIQTTVYCLMHQIDEADIVQVMRKDRPVKPKAPVEPKAAPAETLDTCGEEEANQPNEKPTPKTSKEASRKSVTISVSRISLDDPVMQHRTNFTQVVLPRLRSFVEAVFAIRSNDDKRYQLLIATGDDDQPKKAWQILHNECPWLESCDTPFHREM
jgi:hypothetical protein